MFSSRFKHLKQTGETPVSTVVEQTLAEEFHAFQGSIAPTRKAAQALGRAIPAEAGAVRYFDQSLAYLAQITAKNGPGGNFTVLLGPLGTVYEAGRPLEAACRRAG